MIVVEIGIDVFPSPVKIDYKRAKIVERTTLEVDPDKLKPGEVIIVRLHEWFGLRTSIWVVLNVDGKSVQIEHLSKEEKARALQFQAEQSRH
jgi:hypothetical protein